MISSQLLTGVLQSPSRQSLLLTFPVFRFLGKVYKLSAFWLSLYDLLVNLYISLSGVMVLTHNLVVELISFFY